MSDDEKETFLGYSTDRALTPFFAEFVKHVGDEKLMKSVCTNCGTEYLPPRQHCQKCISECELQEFTEKEAKLRSYVIVHFAPEGITKHRETPYVVGIGEFPSGLRLTAHITNLMSMPEVGMSLKLGYDEIDASKVTYKWLT